VTAIPWVVVGVIALLIGGFFFLRWRRQRNQRLVAEWLEHTEESRKQLHAERASVDKGNQS
jgi:ABC-type long-subunit fatty acid transport system fused permease/ATPase subunit